MPSSVREFVVEADGGSRGNPGPAGYGAVVLDAATGGTLAEAAEYIGVATNNVAEYRGLIAGLRAAHALDPGVPVRVRMDSKLVVEQMSGRWKIKHPDMKPLAAQAAAVYPPGRVTYQWIPRERNKHADRLANEAMDAGKRGEQWSAADSTADLDGRSSPGPVGEYGEPGELREPGDAAAGAAKARAALASAGGRRTTGTAPEPSESGGSADPGASPDSGVPAADSGVPAAGSGASAAETKARADLRAARNLAVSAAKAPAAGWGASADMGPPTTFVLLRHGETPLTPSKAFSGSGGTDPSLSEVGRAQAVLTAGALAARGTVQAIVSSPLKRCRETAQAVADRLGLDVRVDDELRETHFGAWEGLTFGQVRERYPDDLTAWLDSEDARPTGGGESFTEVTERVARARDRLVEEYAGRTVLLVTHVTPVKTLVRLALGAPAKSMFRMELSAAALSAVAYFKDGNASVRLFNETAHLR
ncbi:bifunctional RNase H/acid phosphatase [Streptomyces uncialis]|uniref:bifunctional RNase H/acid phosphatase n=1 Tax=Streptomyces uncialis TaxID=1048205 RepID=UPI002E34F575|nr:bifunctional RNase H/acid phosphatase [Streptomyces uncialis]